MIDWAATGQMLVGIGTICGSLALIIAALVGRSAVEDFRKQKVVERKIDQAETALAVVYQLTDAISEIRSPATWGHESERSKEDLSDKVWFANLPEERKQRYIYANVYNLRISDREKIFTKTFEILPFVRAYFGEEAEKAFRSILRCGRSVRVYADAYAKDTGRNPEFTKKIESIIWEGSIDPDGDKTAIEINQALVLIEELILPIIREERTSEPLILNQLKFWPANA